MKQEYIYVKTTLSKDMLDGKYTVEKVEQCPTGINDAKCLILYMKLRNEEWHIANFKYKLWKGEKYGGHFGFDTSKQIGESYAEILSYSSTEVVHVYELYKKP